MGVLHLDFDDLVLNKDDLTELMVRVRLRILGVFSRGIERDPRRRVTLFGNTRENRFTRSSENALLSSENPLLQRDDTLDTLTDFMYRELVEYRAIFTAEDVDDRIVRRTSEQMLQYALNNLQHRFVGEVLAVMYRKKAEIYYMEDRGGHWQAEQSAVDEYRLWRGRAQKLKDTKGAKGYRDDRNFHGRVRGQLRGAAPGTSIGGTKQGRRAG